MLYGMLSTAVWILLFSSSILGYYAHHLDDDLSIHDLESEGQCTPTGVGGGVAIPLQDLQPSNVDAEEDTPLHTDEPASITTLKYSNAGRIHAQTIARVADWLRWIGKLLAIINAIGIIANSVFQFAGVYDNCYCDSSIYYWGSSYAFNVVSPIQSDIGLARKAWIGALALALTCCTFSVGTIYLIRDSLPS
jgi:hypothetical protein